MGLQTSSNELLKLAATVQVKPHLRATPHGLVKVKGHTRKITKAPKIIDDIIRVEEAEAWLKERWPESDLTGMTSEDVLSLRKVLKGVDFMARYYPSMMDPPDPNLRRQRHDGTVSQDRQFKGIRTWQTEAAPPLIKAMLGEDNSNVWGATGGLETDHDSFVYLSTGKTFREGISWQRDMGQSAIFDEFDGAVHEVAHALHQSTDISDLEVLTAAEQAFGGWNAAAQAIDSEYSKTNAPELFAEMFAARYGTAWRLVSKDIKARIEKFLTILKVQVV